MKHSFLRSVAGTYGTQLALLPLTVGASALQARLVGAEGRGQISLIQTTASVAVLYLGFGLATSIIFHVASGKVSARTLVRPLGLFLLAMTALLLLVLFLLSAVGVDGEVLGSLPGPFSGAIVVGLFVFTLSNSWLTSVLTARKDFGYTNLVSIAIVVLALSAYAFALAMPIPLEPAPYALCVLSAAEAVRSGFLLTRVALREPAATSVAQSLPVRAMITYSLMAYSCDAIQFVTHRLAFWLVRYYRDDAELGHYSLALSLGELVWLLAGAFASVLFPHVATLGREDAIRLSVRVAALSLAASVGISVVGFLLSFSLVPLLFTSAFTPSVTILGLLLVGIAPYSLSKVLGNYAAGVGAMRPSLMAAICGMLTSVILDFLLVPQWGARGAAIATSTAYLVFTAVLLFLFGRLVDRPMSVLWRMARTPLGHSG